MGQHLDESRRVSPYGGRGHAGPPRQASEELEVALAQVLEPAADGPKLVVHAARTNDGRRPAIPWIAPQRWPPPTTCWNALVRAVVQRVSRACVRVAGETVGETGAGLLALVGVTHADGPAEAERMAGKLANLRLFDDDAGVMNRSVLEAGSGVLVVSQFTLYGDTSQGRRPSWSAAAPGAHAQPLVEAVVAGLRNHGLHVVTGRFGARMEVELVNDGPVTVLVEVAPAGPTSRG